MAEAIRRDVPEVAAEWLAPIVPEFEALAVQGEGESDEAYTARIRVFIDNIGGLYERMNRKALEDAMYAANAEGLLLGIRGRITQANAIRSRRRRRTSARLGGG